MAPPAFLKIWPTVGRNKHEHGYFAALVLSFVGGGLLSLAGLTCLVIVGGCGNLATFAPGLTKLLFAVRPFILVLT